LLPGALAYACGFVAGKACIGSQLSAARKIAAIGTGQILRMSFFPVAPSDVDNAREFPNAR
jgi:hypothetical protein